MRGRLVDQPIAQRPIHDLRRDDVGAGADGLEEIDDVLAEAAMRDLLALVAGDEAARRLTFETLQPRDWTKASLAGLKPVTAGRFVVHGGHDRARIAGTGHHGTTRGCLLALDRIARGRHPRRILDVGTGTGVLAIAAAKAFRTGVLASDIDARAVAVAKDNARLNGVPSLIEVAHAIGGKPQKFGRWRRRHQRDKAADGIHHGVDHRNGPGCAGEGFASRAKFSLGLAGRQRQRRLQRRVKAVFSGISGQIAPIRHRLNDAVRKGQVRSAHGIIAEQLRAEAIEIAARRRHIINRITRIACHVRSIGPPQATATASRRATDERIRRLASVRWTRRPAAMTATIRGRSGVASSTRMISARRPSARIPRSERPAARAGAAEIKFHALASGNTPSSARRNAAKSCAG